MCAVLHSDSVDGWETFGDIFLTGLIAFLKRIFIFSKKTKLLGKSCNEECLSLWLCEWLSNEQSNIHLHSKEEKGGRRDNKLIFYFNPCFASFAWIFHFQWSDKAGMRCHCLRLQPPQHILIFSQELLNVKKTELFWCKSIVLASALLLLLNNCFLSYLIMWDFIGWSRRIILAAMAWGVWSKIYSLPLLKKIFWYLLCFLIASLIFWVAVPYQ